MHESKKREPNTLNGEMTPCEYADRVRQMINHENELINHRIQWFLIIQGFLFTAVGMAAKFALFTLEIFIPFISLIGALSSVSAYYSLDAANISIMRLESSFKIKYEDYQGPPIIGLGLKDWNWKSKLFRPAHFLPLLFVNCWLVIAWIPKIA